MTKNTEHVLKSLHREGFITIGSFQAIGLLSSDTIRQLLSNGIIATKRNHFGDGGDYVYLTDKGVQYLKENQ